MEEFQRHRQERRPKRDKKPKTTNRINGEKDSQDQGRVPSERKGTTSATRKRTGYLSNGQIQNVSEFLKCKGQLLMVKWGGEEVWGFI